MPAKKRLTMRQLESFAALEARRRPTERPHDRVPDRRRPKHDPGIPGACRGGRTVLATARRRNRRGAGAAAVSPVGLPARLPAPGRAGLGDGCARTEAARRDADDAVGGIPRGRARWIRLQPVLRPVPRVRAPIVADHAPAPCRGRQGIRGLLGQAAGGDRPGLGTVRPAEIFVGVLGASSYTYAEATWTQTLPD